MSSSTARGGRRRRVLNEEYLNAATIMFSHPDVQAAHCAVAPRYGEQANIEHHPQITDFIPRRLRGLVLLGAIGIGTAIGTQQFASYASTWAVGEAAAESTASFDRLADGMTAWLSAVYMLLAAALARILYRLRRHRIDDYRGRYRVWRWAAWGAALASVASVAEIHHAFGALASSVANWRFTATGVEWWLVPTAVLGCWIGCRATLEAAESRGALFAAGCAWICYAIAACDALGMAPNVGAGVDGTLRAIPLIGHTFTLTALAIFARYVVLDVQGLIDHPGLQSGLHSGLVAESAGEQGENRGSTPVETAPAAAGTQAQAPLTQPEPGATVRRTSPSPTRIERATVTDAASTEAAGASDAETDWVDGSEPLSTDEGDWRLSKSDRKRIRKDKSRRRAA